MGGTKDQVSGRAKEAAGALTDDDSLRREGKLEQFSGDVKDKAGDLADRASDAAQDAGDRIEDSVDRHD